jgi:hypothetical protein
MSFNARPEVLFICGSKADTACLHQVSQHLDQCRIWFTPYYGGGLVTALRGLGLLDRTIAGRQASQGCLEYLRNHHLAIDWNGGRGRYDLIVTCSDVLLPDNIVRRPLLVVQNELWHPDFAPGLVRRELAHRLRRYVAAAATGLSGAYERLCVASFGYRDRFVELGVARDRMVVTGLPGHDDYQAYASSEMVGSGYVLVCGTRATESVNGFTLRRLLQRAVAAAGALPILVQLAPDAPIQPVARWVPHARIAPKIETDALIAGSSLLISPWVAHAYVAMALGKPVLGQRSLRDLHHFVPVQTRSAARDIAGVCRALLGQATIAESDLSPSANPSNPPTAVAA